MKAAGGSWWGVGRKAFMRKALALPRARLATTAKSFEDRAERFDTEWPALAASWRADAQFLRELLALRGTAARKAREDIERHLASLP